MNKLTKHAKLIENISYILHQIDPINIASKNISEYSLEAKTIADRIKDIEDKNQLLDLVYNVFCINFNYGEDENENLIFIANIAGSKEKYIEATDRIFEEVSNK